jgi:hypothetical protein
MNQSKHILTKKKPSVKDNIYFRNHISQIFDKMTSSLFILPIEIVYQILDHLDNFTIYFSLQNVSSRMNTIVHNYDRYRVSLDYFSFDDRVD